MEGIVVKYRVPEEWIGKWLVVNTGAMHVEMRALGIQPKISLADDPITAVENFGNAIVGEIFYIVSGKNGAILFPIELPNL